MKIIEKDLVLFYTLWLACHGSMKISRRESNTVCFGRQHDIQFPPELILIANSAFQAQSVIIRKTISIWANRLEQMRKECRLATTGQTVLPFTTILISVQCHARALTPHNFPVLLRLKFRRATDIQVHFASCHSTTDPSADRRHRNRYVESIHQAHIVKMKRGFRSSERHLNYGCGWSPPEAIAVELAVAVAGVASALALFVEAAALAGPDAARPSVGDIEDEFFTYSEVEATILRGGMARTSKDTWPDAVRAVVDQYQLHCACEFGGKQS